MDLEWLNYWEPHCVARHSGDWLFEPMRFIRACSLIEAGLMVPGSKFKFSNGDVSIEAANPHQAEAENLNGKPYFLDQSGMAVIPIEGQMMKGESKYGGANTVALRRKIRTAAKDADVTGIMLLIDSPGGTVAGTLELAEDVAAANRIKPVFSHADDIGASAAYWVMSQTRRITASSTSEVGSIGTLAVVEDYSAVAERKGIKVHVISTGPYKGAGIPGAPITPEQLAYFRKRVEAVNAHFLDAVSRGRNVSLGTVQEWADGQVWAAEEARSMGLIDGVMLFDNAMLEARSIVGGHSPPAPRPQRRDKRSWIAELENKISAAEKPAPQV